MEGLGGAPPPAMIAKSGEGIVASGALIPRGRVAGLERAARLAGEAFGHEEHAPLPRFRPAAFRGSLSWCAIAFAAIVGLAVLSLR